MLEGKARVQNTDMPARMQAAATSTASRARPLRRRRLPRHRRPHQDGKPSFSRRSCHSMPERRIPLQEFDKRYGVGWQCVVGANFGCFFTHTSGTFIYFSLERLSFLLFKAAAAAAAAAS